MERRGCREMVWTALEIRRITCSVTPRGVAVTNGTVQDQNHFGTVQLWIQTVQNGILDVMV